MSNWLTLPSAPSSATFSTAKVPVMWLDTTMKRSLGSSARCTGFLPSQLWWLRKVKVPLALSTLKALTSLQSP
ncbi:hypothetical protein D3C80_2121080 [compost metagenome]